MRGSCERITKTGRNSISPSLREFGGEILKLPIFCFFCRSVNRDFICINDGTIRVNDGAIYANGGNIYASGGALIVVRIS